MCFVGRGRKGVERRGFFNASRMQSRRWRGTSFLREREKDKERCTSGVFLSVFFASAIAVNYYAYLLVESIFIVTGKFKLRFHFLYLEYRSSVASWLTSQGFPVTVRHLLNIKTSRPRSETRRRRSLPPSQKCFGNTSPERETNSSLSE